MDVEDEAIAELTRADLAAEPPPTFAVGAVARLRESHQRMAFLFALGWTNREVAKEMGYSESRVSVLRSSPAMVELTSRHQQLAFEKNQALVDEVFEQKLQIMKAADRHLRDHFDELDELGELMPAKLALNISADYSDRVGYGRHSTQTNAHVDLGKALENAVARTNKVLELNRAGSPESPLLPTEGGGTVTRFRRPLTIEGLKTKR